jgi:hypothetical protein
MVLNLGFTYLSNVRVNNHQLKLVALTGSGFACPPIGGYFHPPVLLVVLKSELIKLFHNIDIAVVM